MSDEQEAPRTTQALQPLVDAFLAHSVPPALFVVRHRGDAGLAPLFAGALHAVDAASMPEPPEGWHAASLDDAVTLLASCRYRTLAYEHCDGEPAEHLAAARALVEALAARHAWSNSTLATVVHPVTLAHPTGSWGFGSKNHLSGATFEQLVLVEGADHALLAMWTDED